MVRSIISGLPFLPYGRGRAEFSRIALDFDNAALQWSRLVTRCGALCVNCAADFSQRDEPEGARKAAV